MTTTMTSFQTATQETEFHHIPTGASKDDVENLVVSGVDGTEIPQSVVSSSSDAMAPSSIRAANDEDDKEDDVQASCGRRTLNCILDIIHKNTFTIMILCAIGLAKAYPTLGAVYLKPEITSSWLAVALIFCLVGCGLKLNELTHAIGRLRFNAFVQTYDILFISIVVYGTSRALVALGWLDEPLANGMVVCGCLPMSVNAVIIMTAASNGDEGAAVFNTALGNFLGVFVSPPLVVLYLRDQGNVDLGDVLIQLTLKVIVPFCVGQLAQNYLCHLREYYQAHKPLFKKAQEVLLAFIVYTVFCKTFKKGTKTEFRHIAVVILVQLMLMILFMFGAWNLLRKLFPNKPKLHVMGIFGCTQKTIALGVPLIQSMYGKSPYLAMFTLPILIWHPMQLVVGSSISPWLKKYIETETARLEAETVVNGSSSGHEINSQTSEPDNCTDGVVCNKKVLYNSDDDEGIQQRPPVVVAAAEASSTRGLSTGELHCCDEEAPGTGFIVSEIEITDSKPAATE